MRPTSPAGSSRPPASAIVTENPGSGRPTPASSRPSAAGVAWPCASAERSKTRAANGRRGSENVTASAASDRPYTGVIASGRNPQRAKRSAKARTTAGATVSAPLIATSQHDRSTPSISSSRTLRVHNA